MKGEKREIQNAKGGGATAVGLRAAAKEGQLQHSMFTNAPWFSCTVAIIVVTSIYSWIGMRDPAFREKHLFSVREMLAEKQFYRLFTSALLHGDWNHLLLNMVSLWLFGSGIELLLGVREFLVLYLAAVLGGSALSLWIHRHHEYRAYGASGGVCGLVFSYIFLFPGGGIVVFPLPVSIPAWLYAILFFVGSILALKRQADNVGHDAHLGGAIIGLWTAAAMEPGIVRLQPKLFLTISVLSVLFLLFLAKNPLFLPLSSFLPARLRLKDRSRGPRQPLAKPVELDAILEKISRSGLNSLTRRERALLNSASEDYRRRASSK